MRKILIGVLALFLLLASCSPANMDNRPEKISYNENPNELSSSERAAKNNVYLNNENVGNLKESELVLKVKNYAEKIDAEAVNDSLDSKTWLIVHGKTGKKVNVNKTLNLLLEAQEDKKVDLIVEEVLPSVTSQKLLENIKVIGDYTTPLYDRSASRINNIELAAQKIDNFILAPGNEFSFNKVVGRRTEDKGYEYAPVIINTSNGPEKAIDIGGGICQLSTTLFNAVLQCKLEITERHLHSKDVGYVPKGKDATVDYGTVDFKFKNNLSYPIMIKVYLGNKALNIQIIQNKN